MESIETDIAIIGAGAAGLMCGSIIGSGRKTHIIEHNKTAGKKILISGGGRCNFTNIHSSFGDFVSSNPHFFKSALSNYSPHDFIDLIEKYKIPYFEKKLGQLFCKNSAKEVLAALLRECEKAKVSVLYGQNDLKISHIDDHFLLQNDKLELKAQNLVVATGGLSIPTIGASDIGYKIAKQFGHKIIPTRPALVAFKDDHFEGLSGISCVVEVKTNKFLVKEDILITHKGLSGPAILKASLYWSPGDKVTINWLPEIDLRELIYSHKKKNITAILSEYLPNRLAQYFGEGLGNALDTSKKDIEALVKNITKFEFVPSGTEGFKKAEVTVGGVDTSKISSKTMESALMPGLYFIGEILDVTGQLGGHNFQWAWASGRAAGKALKN
ncbi:MAG: aminoacetone oxidase family FAD-binding enzyme [Deltaproteobacteria bacterium]|nr:MAG: aminoacetone oxidase family FAD-binding enzyme [Deltaproteobacteria bacterium]